MALSFRSGAGGSGAGRWLCIPFCAATLTAAFAASPAAAEEPLQSVEPDKGAFPGNQPQPKEVEPVWVQGGGCDAPEPALIPKAKPLISRMPLRKAALLSPDADGGHAFYPLQDKVEPGPSNDAQLQLTITGPSKLAAGEPLRLGIRFRNRTQQQLVVMRPNDGSLEHMRFPHYDLFLQDEKSGQTYRWAFVGGRCGMLNQTRREDHVAIAPGSERANVIAEWGTYLTSTAIPARGAYRVWVAYRFCGYESRGIPLAKDQLLPGVWRGAVSSNTLRIEAR